MMLAETLQQRCRHFFLLFGSYQFSRNFLKTVIFKKFVKIKFLKKFVKIKFESKFVKLRKKRKNK